MSGLYNPNFSPARAASPQIRSTPDVDRYASENAVSIIHIIAAGITTGKVSLGQVVGFLLRIRYFSCLRILNVLLF